VKILKDFQIFMGEWMSSIPGQTPLYRVFIPLAVVAQRQPRQEHISALSNPVRGGHLQWLDPDMPNRNSDSV